MNRLDGAIYLVSNYRRRYRCGSGRLRDMIYLIVSTQRLEVNDTLRSLSRRVFVICSNMSHSLQREIGLL